MTRPAPFPRERLVRWLLLAAGLLAGMAGAAGPAAQEALTGSGTGPAAEPEAVVRQFYRLLADGDCDAARALRPAYDAAHCGPFVLVKVHQAAAARRTDGLALVHLDVEYRLGDQPRREVGCAVLTGAAVGWQWEELITQPCEVIATGALRHDGAPAVPAPTPPAAAANGLDAAPLLPAGPAALPTGLRPKLPPDPVPAALPTADWTAAATPPPDAPPPDLAGPEQTLAAYYAAHDAGDCATVRRLRPGYQHCGSLRQPKLAQVERQLYAPAAGVAVLAFRVSYVPPEATSERLRERFDGLAWLEQDPDGWRIRAVEPASQLDEFTRRFDALVRQPANGTATPGPLASIPAAGPSPLAPAPDLSYRAMPGAGSEPPPAAGPPPAGAVCFTDAELRGSPAEAVIRDGLRPGGTPPDPALVQQAAALRGPWGTPFRGSIRWVDLADPNGRLLALTFDLCEQANEISGYDAAIVDWLREQRVAATFFAGGKWLQSHPERARQLLADPLFEVGNHAWTHGNLRVLKGEELREQILWAQAEALAQRAALAAACPGAQAALASPPTLFRFPYGTCGPEALDLLAELGLAAVQWNIVTGDPARGQSAAGIVRAVRQRLRPGRGHIVIMHANGRGRATAAALRQLVPALRKQGWRFVTVSELLAAGTPHIVDECYELVPGDNARYDRLFGRGTGD